VFLKKSQKLFTAISHFVQDYFQHATMSQGKQVFTFEGEDLKLKLKNEVQKVIDIYK